VQVRIKEAHSFGRFFVCGPPVMNELFDRTFDSMIISEELSRTQVEVM
jgi:hypothetical protein